MGPGIRPRAHSHSLRSYTQRHIEEGGLEEFRTLLTARLGGQVADLKVDPFTGAAASVYKASVPVEITSGPSSQTIVIAGERGTVEGEPVTMVEDNTTGFTEGDLTVPCVKFLGQTSYSAGTAHPAIDADGEIYWQRKTGKKIYVYFTNEDCPAKSDRIIVPAK